LQVKEWDAPALPSEEVTIMAHKVDVHVGKRIRQRRWLAGMTQQKLAELVGIKFQQIQKYETGANRVSASRLWDISDALDVDVSFFFDGIKSGKDGIDGADHAAGEKMPGDLMGDKEAMDLVRSYYAIPENQRRRLFELARVLSDVA
jgi:transcriptional regulator with XRE-family HTH domain